MFAELWTNLTTIDLSLAGEQAYQAEFWTMVILMVISTVITYAMAPKAQPPQPESFEDIEFPQADDGTPQAVIFGDCWSGDWTVLAVGNYRTQEIHSDSGKK